MSVSSFAGDGERVDGERRAGKVVTLSREGARGAKGLCAQI